MRMKRFSVVIFLLLSFLLASASSRVSVRIWSSVRGMGDMSSELYFYPAPDSLNAHIAVIVCPGGSYNHMLGIKKEGFEVAEWLNSQGINAFVLRYRVGSEGYHHPAMIEDFQRSIQIVRARAQIYGIDAHKVGAMVFSAGGHLVLMAGEANGKDYLAAHGIKTKLKLSPDFIVALYPVVSMQDSIVHERSRRNLITRHFTQQLKNELSLELNVPANMPPTFL